MAPRGRAENGLWEPHGKPLDRVGGDLLTGIETGLKQIHRDFPVPQSWW